MTYIAIVYQHTWGEFDIIQEFPTEAEAIAFGETKHNSSVVIAEGTIEAWTAKQIGKPLVIFWHGEPFVPLED